MSDTGYRRGLDLYLYRNTGTYASPTWGLINNCRDLDRGLERTGIESSIRGFANVATEVPGLIKIKPSWEMVYDQSDAQLVAIEAAFWTATPQTNGQIEFAWSDGAIAGTGIRYLRAICAILGMDEAEPLDGIELVKITVSPTYNSAGNAPSINTA